MKVLITGAGGFVGKAIADELQRDRFEIYRLGSPRSENTHNLPNFYRADVREFESLMALEELAETDVIVHAAGLAHQFGNVQAEDFWKTNVEGTKNTALLAVKLKVRQFILISSVAVYGTGNSGKGNTESRQILNFVDEDYICEPQGAYAQSKLAAEETARAICAGQPICLTILRPVTVVGEEDSGNVARLIKTIDKNRFVWVGSGENHKSLIYKGDVARACRMVINKKAVNKENLTEIFNLSAEPLKMKEIVGQIESCLERKIPKFSISEKLLDGLFQMNARIFRVKKIESWSKTIEKWLSEEVFSGEKIKRRYGFRAAVPGIEAIKRETEFYKNRK